MYDSRLANVAVVTFWLATMSWLGVSKIAPLLDRGSAPEQGLALPGEANQEQLVRWRILWKGRYIGTAENRAVRNSSGSAFAESRVHFTELPVTELAKDYLGPAAMLLQWRGGGEEFTTDLDVTSRMQFDAFGHLEQVESHANIAELGELFQLTGRVQDQGIDLVVHTQLPGLANDNPTELFRKRLELPPDALVVDALSPSPRLANLRVGQTWTFRSFRPFPPQRPWQLIKAEVTGTEAYLGAGDYESVFVVQFTDQTSSSLTTSATPFSKLWVRDDGTVVKQQLAMGSVQVDFERDERHDSTR